MEPEEMSYEQFKESVVPEPSIKRIRYIKRVLCADIFWTVKYGPGWDPSSGAKKNGEWHPSNRYCGVCAIGAFCVRRQPEVPNLLEDGRISVDAYVTAKFFKVPYRWMWEVYVQVSERSKATTGPWKRARELARKLRKWGNYLNDQRVELRHDAAQEDQMLARRLGLV